MQAYFFPGIMISYTREYIYYLERFHISTDVFF